ncbi:hypothetical protein CP960_09685 [Malaciobacter halophilus]|uniref:Uncharacterized protein n=1 Tax=Malaciobacter halophilus TaxID=197482 RepID=A0A2N1J1H7_9BACT|nr:hypothetical protein [Malaciobacter halophilus]AXH09719.1 hypothetical protein AHALO_1344 [Malaciobacter halophilus]PKI80408.1 hypothetical protein CP960_09685 [Malaciobacter halophilus]
MKTNIKTKNDIAKQLGNNLVISTYSSDTEIKQIIEKTIQYVKAIPEEQKEEIITLTLSYIKKRVEKKLLHFL